MRDALLLALLITAVAHAEPGDTPASPAETPATMPAVESPAPAAPGAKASEAQTETKPAAKASEPEPVAKPAPSPAKRVKAAAVAETKPAPVAKGPVLSLASYLEQVKSRSPEARAAVERIQSLENKLDEGAKDNRPELYAEYKILDNRAQPLNALSPVETKGRQWKTGVRDKTPYGLNADVFVLGNRTTLEGVDRRFVNPADYEQSSVGTSLTLNLWRDGFGQGTRAGINAKRAEAEAALLDAKFALKNILLKAENTYWSLVSYNEILKLQEENVERARRLRDWMKNRAGLRLFDDVDAMQAEASFQQRELELQTSLDERAGFVRTFNTLRGYTNEQLDGLDELPTSEFMMKTVNDKSKRMSREDFRKIYLQADALAQQSIAANSQIRPQLDLFGDIQSNGLDVNTRDSYDEATKLHHPSWNIGIRFSVPLDYSLIRELKQAYKAQARSAEEQRQQALYSEARAWDELLKQNREAQGRFERSVKLETLQTDLVKRERVRLMNGRSTTNNTLTIEQNLASVQISRVRAQLALLQLHNVIKQYEEIP